MTGLMVRERETLEKYMPGLLQYLDTTPLDRLESRDSDAIDKFREFGGTGLVVPGELGGLGAPAIDAVRAQRAIGSRSPSLGAGTTMHHLSLASLTEFARGATDDDRALIKGLVDQKAIGLHVSVFISIKLVRQKEEDLARFAKAISRWDEVL